MTKNVKTSPPASLALDPIRAAPKCSRSFELSFPNVFSSFSSKNHHDRKISGPAFFLSGGRILASHSERCRWVEDFFSHLSSLFSSRSVLLRKDNLQEPTCSHYQNYYITNHLKIISSFPCTLLAKKSPLPR